MFKKWCFSQKFSNSNNLSHVLMDGGVLSVPSDRLTDFYNKCIECIKVGEPIFVVEQKTNIYNFFLDIDYKDEFALSLETIKLLTKVICDKVESFGGQDCLISIAKPKPCGNVLKSGVHMNWPNFPIDQTNALFLRQHIINLLTKIDKKINWEQVVDKSVYGSIERNNKGSGFRMPWSHKKAKHSECKGHGCGACESGKITESPYLPVFMYQNKNLETIDYTEPCLDIFIASTIRSEATESSQVPPPPDNIEIVLKNQILDSELVAKLQQFITNNITGQTNFQITKIMKHEKSHSCGSTSKYCANVGRNHMGNHVWFSIYEGRVAQKCFDDECKNFSGREYLLSPSILKLLYPDRNVLHFVGTGISSTVLHTKGRKGPPRGLQE